MHADAEIARVVRVNTTHENVSWWIECIAGVQAMGCTSSTLIDQHENLHNDICFQNLIFKLLTCREDEARVYDATSAKGVVIIGRSDASQCDDKRELVRLSYKAVGNSRIDAGSISATKKLSIAIHSFFRHSGRPFML